MVKRACALAAHWAPGQYGEAAEPGVVLSRLPSSSLWQIGAWPASVQTVAKQLALALDFAEPPVANRYITLAEGQRLLRVEPLSWWLLGGEPPLLSAEHANVVDQSHSRVGLSVQGEQARELLNRFLPLDLRPAAFPVGCVASSGFHHVGVTLLRSPEGFELYLPRGFAVSLWQLLFESAKQFGVSVAPS